ncbi:MAG: glycosyltransferase family A protein [Candidatus Hermodarchaeota archaeon]|nr:glycosyltransferase family A protein [Candidatus Hermodarchaeota archaeon]
MTQLKISVITWDASFRESFHTVDFFRDQSFPQLEYEFIWVEYYSDVNPRLRQQMSLLENARIICLGGEGEWHAGICLNEGIKQSRGKVIVTCDGDIAVEPDFLYTVWGSHNTIDNLVLYFRRLDEPENAHELPIRLNHLEQVCQLRNPTNYGGCLTTRRKCIDYVHGYEEHLFFAGAGAISKELYTRLKNAGFPIMWHPIKKVYHPWHANTLRGTYKLKRDQQLWVIRCRDLSVDYLASIEQAGLYSDSFTPQTKDLKSPIWSMWQKIRNLFRKTQQIIKK